MLLVLDNAVDGGYMADEVARLLPDDEVRTFNYPNEDGDPDLAGVDGVVIGGSGAGVYEEPDRPWITRQKAFVREVVEAGIPLLGICFGHQVINEAFGGTVEDSGVSRCHLVETDLDETPLFEGVADLVPVLHSDLVTEPGEGMAVVGRTDYDPYHATRHEDHPVWTVQFHPEFTPAIVPEYEAAWEETEHRFADSTATETLANFSRFCREHAAAGD